MQCIMLVCLGVATRMTAIEESTEGIMVLKKTQSLQPRINKYAPLSITLMTNSIGII